jgi:hypothetical protein
VTPRFKEGMEAQRDLLNIRIALACLEDRLTRSVRERGLESGMTEVSMFSQVAQMQRLERDLSAAIAHWYAPLDCRECGGGPCKLPQPGHEGARA